MITCTVCRRDCTGDAVVRADGWLCRPCATRPDRLPFVLVGMAIVAVALLTIVITHLIGAPL